MKKILTSAGFLLLAASVLSGCSQMNVVAFSPGEPEYQDESLTQDCLAGFESIWTSSHADGTDHGHPQETVTVLTDSGKIIDAHNQEQNKAGTPEELGITYEVKQDASWPKASVVIIDTSNDKVIKTFALPTDMPLCD